MATAMALGLWLAYRDARRRGLDPEKLLKASELALLGGLVGARLYYVVFNLDYYSQFPAKIFAVWEGGLAIHGGVLGGLLRSEERRVGKECRTEGSEDDQEDR